MSAIPNSGAIPKTGTIPKTLSATRKAQNIFATTVIYLATAIVLLPLFFIFYYVIVNGVSALNWAFFSQSENQSSAITGGGGVLNAIVGTVIMVGIATVIGLVVGIATGIFLAEYREHKLVPIIRVMSDVLSGIPAIVVGLVVYGILVSTKLPGYSGLAGGVALGFIMLPVIVRATEEVLKLVPQNLREAGLALGLPRWRVIMQIVLPTAQSGIITGVVLAIARVSGEAAPLLFTSLGNPFLNFNPSKPMSAMPLTVFNFAFRAVNADQNKMAWAGALVLMLGVFFISVVARRISRR